MKKNKISKTWINKQKRDIYVRKSKLEGYRSRAIYKLKEIDEKFRIVKNGINIVDLGSAPGSWSQYLSEKSKNSKILSIDLKEVKEILNVSHLVGDFLDENNQIKLTNFFNDKLDLVVSDMAVNTTGNKDLDSISTGELSINAMNFSIKNLKKNGSFVSKIFMGSTFKEILINCKKNFKEVKIFKPPSSRKDSKESFIICKKIR
ncbi:RlmE family RNA methyltransferase [Candidatus Pelagibacter sp.]|nr:RlmE family RNA methyltransferase [Candidatus Pelagibacter sp.]